MDVVTVVVVDYENVAIATTGGNKETAREIGGNLAGDELTINEQIVRSHGSWFVIGVACWRHDWIHGVIVVAVVRVGRCRRVGGRRGLGGSKIRPLLIEMPLDHWDREGRMPSYLGGCEIRPPSVVARERQKD